MIRARFYIFITLLTFGGFAPAHAKTFMNSYVNFDISDRWNCELEQTEWLCRTNEPGEAQAIIILTAKEVGPQDSLTAYETHLRAPKTIKSRAGRPLQSTVYQVERQTINLQPWVNGFQFDSEVVNYYTRYLATIKEGIAILVTFSAHRNAYTKYSADFFRAIASLNVVITKASLKASGRDNALSSATGLNGTGFDPQLADESALPPEDEEGAHHRDRTKVLVGFGLIFGALLVLFIRVLRGERRRR